MGKHQMYCAGKIMKVNTGNIDGENQDRYIWSEEEGCNGYSYPRRDKEVRFEGKGSGNQSQRVNRAYGSQSCFFNSRTANAGGILTQLIEETRQQLADNKVEGIKLRDRLQKLELLFDQLEEIE